MALTPAQSQVLKTVLEGAPDVTLMRLCAAMSAAASANPAFAPVAEMAASESQDRFLRDLVLEPLKSLADPTLEAPKRALLSPRELTQIWRVIKTIAPEDVVSAALAAAGSPPEEGAQVLFDRMCLKAADALRNPGSANPQTRAFPPQREELINVLDFSPVLRAARPKLVRWLRSMSVETIAAIRLAYKDATTISEDVGPLFMEALIVYLDEPCQILRLISAVMDQPSDRYLASSELAPIGERLLADIEARVTAVRRFDPSRGCEGGTSEAASVSAASFAAREFEQWVALSRDGPWGGRVLKQKLALVSAVESHFRAAELAVARALPMHHERLPGALSPRQIPKIDGFPEDNFVRRAEALLVFLDETRSSASFAGFGAVRARTSEGLSVFVDAYVEELIERLRGEECFEPDWVRAHLDVAADFAGLLNAPKAAQIVRRRAAAA